MKLTTITASLSIFFLAQAQAMTCSNHNARLIPVDNEAKQLAQSLKVSYCDSKTFQAALSILGKKQSIAPLSDADRIAFDKSQDEKRIERVKKKLIKAGIVK